MEEDCFVEPLGLTRRREKEKVSGPVAGKEVRKVGTLGQSQILRFPKSWLKLLNETLLELVLVDDEENDDWVIVIRRPRGENRGK